MAISPDCNMFSRFARLRKFGHSRQHIYGKRVLSQTGEGTRLLGGEPGFGRRHILLTIILISKLVNTERAVADEDLVIYENRKRNFRLQRPGDWKTVDKAGAEVLFQAPALRSTDIGVTVSPSRISQLVQLGDLFSIGEKLLAAERKKESTKSAEMLQQFSDLGRSGTMFYVFEYIVNTTRGDKHIWASVGVADNKLYIVNGTIKCAGFSCRESTPMVKLVERSVRSFDVIA